MTSSEALGPKFRVLLIGIDDYARKPLRGSVNDIDAVQRIFLQDLGVPAERIQRLASPRKNAKHETTLPDKPATLANIREAFAHLTEEARLARARGEIERILIYYSGHGMRTKLQHEDERTADRESLVPFDFDAAPEPTLLFDYQMNELLGELTKITRSVTCILDCCHSAGATRDFGDPDLTSRFLDPSQDLSWPRVLRAPEDSPAPSSVASRGEDTAEGDGIARTIDDCHVVAACMNHQLAYENTGDDGRRHGRLTRAFVRALKRFDRSELPNIPWTRIWQDMRAEVESQQPAQNLWMSGNPARLVLAGPPVECDPGFPIRLVDDAYEIAAGSLASVTTSALVAVYGEDPPYFWDLGSKRDLDARRGVLRVTSAELASAKAMPDGPAFVLPPGARGRLIRPGEAARLRCTIRPWNDDLAAEIGESRLLQVVPGDAPVRLEQAGDRWLVTDNLHGTDPASALFALWDAELDLARPLLEHYFAYALPLRMAQSIEDKSSLTLHVLACPDDVPRDEAQDPALAEAETAGEATYSLPAGARVCFRVHNKMSAPLRVTLLNSAASGRVQILGSQVIDGRSSYVFWPGGDLGKPGTMALPPGKSQGIDQLVAVGTTVVDKSLEFLRVDRGFAQTIAAERGDAGVMRGGNDLDSRDVVSDAQNVAIVEHWTAAQAIIRVKAK